MGLTDLPWWHFRRSLKVRLILTLTMPFLMQGCFVGGMSFWLVVESSKISQRLAAQVREEVALRAWQMVMTNAVKSGSAKSEATKNTNPNRESETKQTTSWQGSVPSFQDLTLDLAFDQGSVVVFNANEFDADAKIISGSNPQINDLSLSAIGYIKRNLPPTGLKYQQNLTFTFEREHRKYRVMVRPYVIQSSMVQPSGLVSVAGDGVNVDASSRTLQTLQNLLVLVIVPEDDWLTDAPSTGMMILSWMGLSLSLILGWLWIWLVCQWLLKTMAQIKLDCQQITAQIKQAGLNFNRVKVFPLRRRTIITALADEPRTKNYHRKYQLNPKKIRLRKPDGVPLDLLDNLQQKFPLIDLISRSWVNPVVEWYGQWQHLIAGMQQQLNQQQGKMAAISQDLMLAHQETLAMQSWLKADSVKTGAEIKIARQIQKMLLPNRAEMTFLGLDIAGYMQPMDQVGGDYYDVLQTAQGITLAIGDVTGHGLDSGILMLMTQTAVRTLTEINQRNFEAFFNAINRTIYHNIRRMNSDKCLSLVILNYDHGKLTISGQHEDILIVRHNGIIERIDTFDLGFPIGLEPDISEFIKYVSIYLEPGDGVVLYTDGITEAQNLSKQLYGIEQLCNLVQKHWQESAYEIQKIIISDVAEYIGPQKIMDDITVLILKRSV